MASELYEYTSDCTISFIDLYQKVLRNFPEAREVTTEERLVIGENFARIADEEKATAGSGLLRGNWLVRCAVCLLDGTADG